MADWIKGAIKHPGALRAKAQAAGESTHQFAEQHKGDSGTTGQQSRLGLTLMGMHGGHTGAAHGGLIPGDNASQFAGRYPRTKYRA